MSTLCACRLCLVPCFVLHDELHMYTYSTLYVSEKFLALFQRLQTVGVDGLLVSFPPVITAFFMHSSHLLVLLGHPGVARRMVSHTTVTPVLKPSADDGRQSSRRDKQLIFFNIITALARRLWEKSEYFLSWFYDPLMTVYSDHLLSPKVSFSVSAHVRYRRCDMLGLSALESFEDNLD